MELELEGTIRKSMTGGKVNSELRRNVSESKKFIVFGVINI